jgi:hypothetical protein
MSRNALHGFAYPWTLFVGSPLMEDSDSDCPNRPCGGSSGRVLVDREKGENTMCAVSVNELTHDAQVKNPVMPLWLWKQPSFAAIWFAAFFMQAWQVRSPLATYRADSTHIKVGKFGILPGPNSARSTPSVATADSCALGAMRRLGYVKCPRRYGSR